MKFIYIARTPNGEIKISYTYQYKSIQKVFDVYQIIRLYLWNHDPRGGVQSLQYRLNRYEFGEEFLNECDKYMGESSDYRNPEQNKLYQQWVKSMRDEELSHRLYTYYRNEMLGVPIEGGEDEE